MKIDDIPYGYAHCYATAEQCTQRENCLRSHAARMNEEDLSKPREIVSCVTPIYLASVASGKACRHFRSDAPLRYARGMKKLFDAVPKGQYGTIRTKVMNCFSSERVFYYAQRGDQLISPKEQARISAVFKSAGFTVPMFDTYELSPDWTA